MGRECNNRRDDYRQGDERVPCEGQHEEEKAAEAAEGGGRPGALSWVAARIFIPIFQNSGEWEFQPVCIPGISLAQTGIGRTKSLFTPKYP